MIAQIAYEHGLRARGAKDLVREMRERMVSASQT